MDATTRHRETHAWLPLDDLSQQFGISRDRVRQIEMRAFEKLRKAIKTRVVEQRIDAM